jgi:hypothetical protein
MDRPRALALVAACVAACALLGWWTLRAPSGVGPFNNPTDFVAFYCAGKVAAERLDPYRAEPLRSCERAAFAESQVPMVRGLVVPAPLPGYDLALLAPLGRLPFRPAALVWAYGIFACVAATVWLLGRLTGLRPAYAFAALAGSDLYASFVPGQLVAFEVCALAACGFMVARDRPRAAAACACAMLVEPHLGLPVVLALALWLPRARLVLLAGTVAAAVLSLAFLGVAQNVEYVARVLPSQAATEGLEFTRQYGLSAALHALGLSARAALAAGTASYLGMLIIGTLAARRAARAFAAPALLAFVPAAAVLVGGAYAHIAEMCVAIPLALVLCARVSRARGWAVAATVCLAIPWQSLATVPEVASLFPPRGYVDPVPLLARVSGGGRLAQDAWAAWIATTLDRDHRNSFEVLLFKLPTWLGLASLFALVWARLRLAAAL